VSVPSRNIEKVRYLCTGGIELVRRQCGIFCFSILFMIVFFLFYCDKRTLVWYQVWLGVAWALCYNVHSCHGELRILNSSNRYLFIVFVSAELSKCFDSYLYPFSDPSVQIRNWLSVFRLCVPNVCFSLIFCNLNHEITIFWML
jgi:hypothetical protein